MEHQTTSILLKGAGGASQHVELELFGPQINLGWLLQENVADVPQLRAVQPLYCQSDSLVTSCYH